MDQRKGFCYAPKILYSTARWEQRPSKNCKHGRQIQTKSGIVSKGIIIIDCIWPQLNGSTSNQQSSVKIIFTVNWSTSFRRQTSARDFLLLSNLVILVAKAPIEKFYVSQPKITQFYTQGGTLWNILATRIEWGFRPFPRHSLPRHIIGAMTAYKYKKL